MGWSLSPIDGNNRPHTDSAISAAGRALYLANAFESKCVFILRTANLNKFISDNDGARLDEAIASLPNDQFLANTLRNLADFQIAQPEHLELLARARRARNFIAHEGAAFGYVFSASKGTVLAHRERLREEVVHLARGDNLVSRICYWIEENASPPRDIAPIYVDLCVKWVLGS